MSDALNHVLFRSEEIIHTQRHHRRSRLSPLHLEVLDDRCLLSYTITDLGTLGGLSGDAHGINEAGHVVGLSTTRDLRGHAFLWDGGGMTDLGTLGGRSSVANAVNQTDQVVGFSDFNAQGQQHAFLWQDGGLTDLTPGSQYSTAYGINDAGQVVGYAQPGGAFLWQDGAMINLGTLGGSGSEATKINNAGQVVGAASLAGNKAGHAFLWDSENGMQDLGALPGGDFSEATAVNSFGQAVGYSNQTPGELYVLEAVLFAGGKMTDLGSFVGGSVALGINDAGVVVGWAFAAGRVRMHGFVYAGGTTTELNDLVPRDSGLTIESASGINNAGQIAATALGAGGPHAVLLTPDEGGAPRDVAPGMFRVLASVPEAAGIEGSTSQPQANGLQERAAAEAVAPLPADAALRRATDSVFTSSHRMQTPAQGNSWEVEGFAVLLSPPLSA